MLYEADLGGRTTPTRNVVLTDRQATPIDGLVRSGRYQNASEVMREGLRLVENREVEEATKLKALQGGPDVPGIADRGEILQGLRTLHVARRGRRGRHFIMYRPGGEHTIEVVGILHDAMNLARHITPETTEVGVHEPGPTSPPL